MLEANGTRDDVQKSMFAYIFTTSVSYILVSGISARYKPYDRKAICQGNVSNLTRSYDFKTPRLINRHSTELQARLGLWRAILAQFSTALPK